MSEIAARLDANALALDALTASVHARYPGLAPAYPADDPGGPTVSDMQEMYAEVDRYNAEQRRKALVALWTPPVVDTVATKRRRDGVICYTSNRGDDWTFWRALCASYGLIFARYAKDGMGGFDMAYWDAGPVYGGYTVEVLRLYPGCRIKHYNDGEAEHGY